MEVLTMVDTYTEISWGLWLGGYLCDIFVEGAHDDIGIPVWGF